MADMRPFSAVQFTRESAERIASVVRAIETAPPAAAPLTFARQFPVQIPRQVRAAKFDSAWPIGSSKIVRFAHAPTGTAAVINLSWPITSTAYVDEDCLVGRDGTNWWLIVPVLQTATAVFCTSINEQTVLTGVSVSGALNPNSCVLELNVSTQSDSIVTMSGTTTATYLSLRVPA